jgi:phage-related protein
MAPGTEARPLVWLHGEIKTPPFSLAGRIDAGELLRQLQRGERVGMPHSRPLPSIGPGCHELRIWDSGRSWRIVYCVDVDAILIVEVFAKKTRATPIHVIETCRQRLATYRRFRARERGK